MSNDARRAILARRARFVAAAVASVGIACGKSTVVEDSGTPQPCLSTSHLPEPVPDANIRMSPDPPVATTKCDPPYTITDGKMRKYKRECL